MNKWLPVRPPQAQLMVTLDFGYLLWQKKAGACRVLTSRTPKISLIFLICPLGGDVFAFLMTFVKILLLITVILGSIENGPQCLWGTWVKPD